MDLSLQTSYEEQVAPAKGKNARKSRQKGRAVPLLGEVVTSSVEEVTRFLNKYKTAKIVVAIDTHSLDNGFFAFEGNSATSYKACSMLEVNTWKDP